MHEELRAALAGLLDGLPPKQAAQAVERLIANYRGRTPTDAPVLRDRADVAAYAAYRMPATFEAVRAALAAFAARVPDWSPATHVDIGGGTGAATWATAATWEGSRSTVLDWAQPALDLGRELAAKTLPDTTWQRATIGEGLSVPAGTDLVTVSYVLGELRPEDRHAVVAAAATAARTVVLIEPGTPEGYLRIREARTQLTEAGLRIVAPCPHSDTCPIVPLVRSLGAPPAVAGGDWCHFAARVNRSSLHRQVKGGSLPYEDEKFSYVAATTLDATPAPARIIRKPQLRKGQVLLDLCTAQDGLQRTTVTKRHGTHYRDARDASWGDDWS
ncbi:Ribosomal protein RSM22 (predicted rRNA methylase) [Streptomyces sp. 2224.1]|uniref:small ribosomal subunit Rsm22 family protein n=1 Tax=Streptomyces sp. 2224.1 TaxID=1881020 RepID=UPI00089CEBEA|nr:small ribosomal subunit Rsm22 family protein [Streptomyces sp. 2224.1]SEC60398.1 Ribosomal protein RSM22 (predicted rRNA methylase) [Streptomyces sp. 2224.1]